MEYREDPLENKTEAGTAPAAAATAIRYADIMYSQPAHLPRAQGKPRRIRLLQVLLCWAVIMVVYYFAMPWFYYYVSSNLPLLSFLDQLLFLVGSILSAVILRADLKEVFPLKKPRLVACLGVLVIVAGAYLMADVISVITMYIAPHQLEEMGEQLEGTLSVSNILLEFLLMSLVPAICEEALHRGLILSGLKETVKNRTWVILISGALFGLFHIYPIRWATPAILGCVMAWIVLETGNMFYTFLMHFCYNGLLTIVGYIYDYIDKISGYTPTAADYAVNIQDVGFYLTWYGVWVPILFYIGCYLIRRAEAPRRPSFIETGKERQTLLKIFLPAFIILALGIFCLFRQ